MRRTFWVGGWNATNHDHSKLEKDTETSVKLSTADAPFFSFLGKSKFEFYSNDTAVLGLDRTETARKHSKSSAHGDEHDVHLDYKEFVVPEQKISLFNYNYDPNSDKAVDDIVLLQAGASSIRCKECYLYAG
jgi:hypothetical protein